MKIVSKFCLCLLFISLLITSCRDDQNVPVDDPNVTNVIPPQIDVTASVYGIVKDQTGEPIASAKVTVHEQSIGETDENGFFKSDLITLNQYGSNIRVEKSGYFLGSRFVQPTANKASYMELVLVEKSLSGTFDASTGGTITSNGSAQIDFPSNAIVDENGNAHTGTVSVFSYWYDPSSYSTLTEMPGDLRAVNSNDEFQQLGTYGMIAVELEDGSGNTLQIADGSSATLTMPVPSSLLSSAPSSIPMWHFDEPSGYWVEEGSATLVSDAYIAEVSHFSFWNCDVPQNFIELSGTITFDNGEPAASSLLKLTDISSATYGYAYTDSSGYYSLKVPKDVNLTMEIADYCGDVFFTDNLGPYSMNSTYDAVVPFNSSPWVQLTGTITDCADMGITNGYLKVRSATGSYYNIHLPDTNGNIDVAMWDCGNWTDLELQAFNRDDNTISQLLPITLVSPATDFGILRACDQNPEYLDYVINGFNFELFDPSVTSWQNGLRLDGWDLDSSSVTIYFEEQLGIQSPSYLSASGETAPGQFVSTFCQGCTEVDLEITELGVLGEFVAGTWSGTVPASGGSPAATVSGSFRAQRE